MIQQIVSNPQQLSIALADPTPKDVIVRKGTYPGSFTVACPGTLQPYGSDHVIFDGNFVLAPFFGMSDVEVFQSAARVAGVQRPNGVVLADSSYVRRCKIHDCGSGVVGWKEAPNATVEGCVIYHNGSSTRDHGIYMQNAAGSKNIFDNQIFENFGMGIQIYGSDTAPLNGFNVDGNFVWDNGVIPGVVSDPQRNLLVGGPVANDISITRNTFSYRLDGHQPTWGVLIGKTGGKLVVSKNILNDTISVDATSSPCPDFSDNVLVRGAASVGGYNGPAIVAFAK